MKRSLKKLKGFSGRPGPLLLIIMDGVGIGKRDDSDGVYLANTPILDSLMAGKLYTTIKAHGRAVGMPSDADMGNSEVGHNTLGAGRVFAQGASLVNDSIVSGKMFETDLWKQAMGQAKEHTLHFIGLLSDGNVHSHIDHLFSMLTHAVQNGVMRVRIHTLLDGRDVYEKSAPTYIEKTEKLLASLNKTYATDYKIASGGGRMITTMDRYNADWTIVKRGWDTHVLGKGQQFASAFDAVSTYYAEDPTATDQYLNPFVIAHDGAPVGTVNDGDVVINFNFRGDRSIEISRAFEEENFKEFDRERHPDIMYMGMTQYDGDLHVPARFLVNPPEIEDSLSMYLCDEDVTSFAISETQKYGHVTYFWNGNNSGYIDETLETYVEIPSDKIRFDLAPKMKAYEITEKAGELLRSGKYKFGRINLANGDMVGHSGVPSAIITAVETVDECLGKLIQTVNELNGITIVLADHGNSDEMYTIKDGKKIVSTAHSLNPVPFAIADSGYKSEYEIASVEKKGLSNVAATIFNLLGYEKPKEYDPSLITFKN